MNDEKEGYEEVYTDTTEEGIAPIRAFDIGGVPVDETVESYIGRVFPTTESEAGMQSGPLAYTDRAVGVTSNSGLSASTVTSNTGPGWTYGTGGWSSAAVNTVLDNYTALSEIEIREKAIEATCKALGNRDVDLTEFGQALDYFYNYLKFGTKLTFGNK